MGLSRRTAARLPALGLLAALLTAGHTPDSPVADAAMAGDLARVEALLADGADVSAPQGDGMTALHWAARSADARLARLLLGAGADVTATTRIGAYTALHMASEVGSAEVVELLLVARRRPDRHDRRGRRGDAAASCRRRRQPGGRPAPAAARRLGRRARAALGPDAAHVRGGPRPRSRRAGAARRRRGPGARHVGDRHHGHGRVVAGRPAGPHRAAARPGSAGGAAAAEAV